MTEQKPQTGTQSIERAFDILRVVAAGPAGGMRLKDIAEETGLYGPTAHRILTTLQTGGLIERRRDSALYVIGSELALLGLGSSFRRFRELAAPTLRNLSDEVDRRFVAPVTTPCPQAGVASADGGRRSRGCGFPTVGARCPSARINWEAGSFAHDRSA
jgi:hypothetical protein